MLKPSTDRNEVEAHQALTLLIKQEADRLGVLSFARFMELALYSPGLGFYERSENVIGRSGDFFTSVSVGRLFGELLACQFTDWIKKTPAERPVIVEAGAHDGQLAVDILTKLGSLDGDLLRRFEYWILEPSARRQGWQKAKLSGFSDNVRWFQSWTDLSSNHDKALPLDGVVFSNELLDAMPFHRLQWDAKNQTWSEQGVTFVEEHFAFEKMPLSDEVKDYLEVIANWPHTRDSLLLWPRIPPDLQAVLPDGFIIEVCPQAVRWWQQAAQTFHRGRILALDYGSTVEAFVSPERMDGTARGFRKHQQVRNLLATPGRNDITASVNFSAIQLAGQATGLHTERYETQSRFLTRILSDCWKSAEPGFNARQAREFQLLTHPDHLGTRFQALVQSKGVNDDN